MRSAGSFGLYDLAAFKSGHVPALISCKINGTIPKPLLIKTWETAQAVDAVAVFAWRIQRGHIGWVLCKPTDTRGWHPIQQEAWNPDGPPDRP